MRPARATLSLPASPRYAAHATACTLRLLERPRLALTRAHTQVSSAWTAALCNRRRTSSGEPGLPCFEADAAPYPTSAALPSLAYAAAVDGRWQRRGGAGNGGGAAAAMAIDRLLNPVTPPDRDPEPDVWRPDPWCLG